MTETTYNDRLYCPPARTLAGLMFPARSKLTVRGFTIAKTPADGFWRQIIYASQGERETSLLALAMPNLWNLFDQPKPVSFVDVDGTQRTHRFDYLSVLKDGTRIAMAVKPWDKVISLNFKATLSAIERDMPMDFADKLVLVTEHQRHRMEVLNAELLNFFRRCPDPEADDVVADLIGQLFGEVPIAEIVRKSGLGARAYRAAFRAIYEGKLRANKREFITANSIVARQEQET